MCGGICSSGEARATQGSILIYVYYWGTRTDSRISGYRYGPNVKPRAAGGVGLVNSGGGFGVGDVVVDDGGIDVLYAGLVFAEVPGGRYAYGP